MLTQSTSVCIYCTKYVDHNQLHKKESESKSESDPPIGQESESVFCFNFTALPVTAQSSNYIHFALQSSNAERRFNQVHHCSTNALSFINLHNQSIILVLSINMKEKV